MLLTSEGLGPLGGIQMLPSNTFANTQTWAKHEFLFLSSAP